MTASCDVLRYRAAPSATRRPPPGWPSDEENKPPSFAWANGPALASACACPEDVTNLTTAVPAELFDELAAEHLIPMAVDRS